MKSYILRKDSLKAFNKEFGINSVSVIICFNENETYCVIDGTRKMKLSKSDAQRFISDEKEA